MDAELFHARATASPVRRPEPVAAEQLAVMNDTRKWDYLDALAKWVGKELVDTEAGIAVKTAMDKAFRQNCDSPLGAKNVLCLNGSFGVGKSTLMKKWAEAHYVRWTRHLGLGPDGLPEWCPDISMSGAKFTPVVWVNLSAGARIKAFDQQVLEFIGVNPSGAARELTSRITAAIRIHGIRMLVIDDAHLLRTDWADGRQVLDHIKHMITELGEHGASLVLIGAEMRDGPILSDPQLATRLRLVSMTPMRIDSRDEKRAWQIQLKAFEEMLLPFLPKTAAGTLPRRFAPLIWRRTQGYVGEAAILLKQAMLLAVEDGSMELRESHLTAVDLGQRAQDEERWLEHSRV